MRELICVVVALISLMPNTCCMAALNLDTPSARKWFPELAENTPEALEIGGKVDQIKAAADSGDPVAICRLGKLTFRGVGVRKSQSKAFELFKRAAELGCAEAYKCMSTCCGLGIGVAKDEKEMHRLLVKSAQGGYVPAMITLGMDREGRCGAYKKGETCDGNKPDCPLYWYRMAADKGSLDAKILMVDVYAPIYKSTMYEGFNGKKLGHNLHRDLHVAADLLKELNRSGDERIVGIAAYKIGMLLAIMSGLTPEGLAKYGESSYRWFERGAYYWNEDARRELDEIERRKYNSDTVREKWVERTERVKTERRKYRYTHDELLRIFERGHDGVDGKPGYHKRMSPMDAVVLTRYYYPDDYVVLDDDLSVYVYLSSRRFGDEKPILICKSDGEGGVKDFDLRTIERVKHRLFLDDCFYVGMTLGDARCGAEKYYAPADVSIETNPNGGQIIVKGQKMPLCRAGKDGVVWQFNFGRPIYDHWFCNGNVKDLKDVVSRRLGMTMTSTNIITEICLSKFDYVHFSRYKDAPSPDVKEDFETKVRFRQSRSVGTVSNVCQVAILGSTEISEENGSPAPKLVGYYPNIATGDFATSATSIPAWVTYVVEELNGRIAKFSGDKGIIQITIDGKH